jgi:hypothetical protein
MNSTIRPIVLAAGLLLLLLAGCGAPAPEAAAPEGAAAPPPVEGSCTTKDCLIAAGNACKAVQLTLTEDAGTFTYAITAGCTFTKTLVEPSPEETPEMKSLLRGASMTCKYQQGAFDSRWVTSLFGGLERCEGELRGILAHLAAFA